MSQSVGMQFPTKSILQGQEHFDLITNGVYRYQGGDPSDTVTNWLLVGGELIDNPDTALWGSAQAGALWFSIAASTFRGWNGTSIVDLS